ncbi:MAG: PAS domain-containing sensor histidine kinase [Methanomicrobiales archaeon]
MNEVKALYPSLILVFLSMLVIMFVYELAKQMLNPSITIWESHAVTIVFASVISLIIIYIPLRSSYLEHQQTIIALSHQQEAEEKLRQSEMQYRSFVESIEDSIYTVDRDCRYLLINARHLFRRGLSPWMYEGKRFSDFHSQEETAIFTGHVARVLASKSPVQDEYEQKGRHYLRKLSPVIDPKVNEVIAVTVISSDITEQKELEKEQEYHEQELRKFSASLAAANKKLSLLSSITRHDINNQLTVLVGYLTILQMKQPDTTHNDYFEKVATSAQRISAMIQFTGEYEKIGVNAPVWKDTRTIVENAAKQATLGQVIVKNDLPAGTEIFADPLVVKVFYNLMDNAVRYGGKISTIRFSFKECDGDQILVCEDDGDGVVAEEKERIFERGFGKNTGMGLALSQEILSITGINISETGEPGKGARFEMLVPKGAYRFSDVQQ